MGRVGRDRGELLSGDSGPAIAPVTPRTISFPSAYEPGSILIDASGRNALRLRVARLYS